MSEPAIAASEPELSCADRVLPSGRSVLVKIAEGREELEVRSPSGDVEVRVTLTADGPVVTLRGARLELESPDTIAVNCRRLEVSTAEATSLTSGGTTRIDSTEVRMTTTEDIHMNGAFIRLN